MSTCIILNPHAGRGRVQQRFERFRAGWHAAATLWLTQAPGHARQLACQAAEQGFAIVAAAGGDGTVHEVANGLLAASRRESTLAVIPLGSANDYAYSLKQQFGAKTLGDDQGSRVDVGLVRTSAGRQQFFVESIGIGLSARVTLESLAIERRGLARYALATYLAVTRDLGAPEMQLQWDDRPAQTAPTLMASLLVGRREGNFPLAPAALLDDGLFDFIHAARLTRWQALRMLPVIALLGPPKRHSQVRLGRCRSLRVQSSEPLVIHTDGEMFCTPHDGLTDAEIVLLPNQLRAKVVQL